MPEQRADAVRNREAVLRTAAELVQRAPASELRIGDVAAGAGVGPATIYRAFGDRSGLLLALLDEDERKLQDELIGGDPPLGPGAPAADRLLAFVDALHELTVRRRQILAAADSSSLQATRRSGAYQSWRLHLRNLLAELRPEADPELLAELLLAPFSAPLQIHLLDDRGKSVRAVRAELRRLAQALI